MVVLKASEHVT